MPYEKDEREIGALWVRVSKGGTRFMSGKINGEDVVLFENKNKQGKQPDWRVLKSEPRDDAASRRQHEQREAPRRASRVDDIEDEVGF